MTTLTQTMRCAPVVLAVVGALLLSACEEAPIVDLSAEENGRPVLKTVTGPGQLVFPAAEVGLSDVLIVGFDFGVTDGFSRSVAPADAFQPVDNPFGATGAYDVGPAVPGSNVDSRLPAVQEADAGVDFWGLFNPAFTGVAPGAHDFFGDVTGLKPETTYSVVLARMSLTVNGELDQQEILTGRSVANPDVLTPLGGTPTGYPGVTCNFTAVSVVTASTNPVMLGTVTTDRDGNVTVDCIPFATGDSPWYRDNTTSSPAGATNPDSMPFGANIPGATLAPGQFNYAMLYEGVGTETDPTPTENPAVRVQLGPDIDANGNVIHNGFAPFPGGITSLSTFTSLPGGSGAFAAPGTITVDALGLPALPSGGFEVKVFSRETGAFTTAQGLVSVDGEAASRTSTFGSPGPESSISITLDGESGVDFAANSHLVVTLAGADDSEFLFHEYLGEDLALLEGNATFGGFDGPDDNFAYIPSGSGQGEFFGDSLLVRLNRVPPRTPDGFHYQSYLLSTRDGVAPARLHAVELDALGNGADRIAESEAGGNWGTYNFWVMVLEPANAQVPTSMQIQITEDYQGKFSGFFPRNP